MNFGSGGAGGGSNPPPWARQSGAGGAGYGFNNQQFGQSAIGQPSGLAAAMSGLQTRAAGAQGGAAPPKQRVFTGRITKVKDTFGFVDEDVFFQTSVCKGGTPQVGDQVLVEANYNENMPFKWNATRLQIIPNTQPTAVPQPNAFQQAMAQQVQQQMSVLQAAQAAAINRNVAAQSVQRATTSSHLSQSPYKPGAQTQSYKPVSSSTTYNAAKQSSSGSSSTRPSRFEQRSSNSSAPPPVSVTRPPAVARSAPARHEPSPRRERSPRRYSPTPSTASSAGRKRSRSPRARSRSPVRRRSRSPPPRKRSRSRSSKRVHRRSPARREKAATRYNVQISQHTLDTALCRLTDLRPRYSNLYVPSDFTRVLYPWLDSFALTRPLSLGQPVSYHILKGEVSAGQLPGVGYTEPSDADFSYSAKVFLLAGPSLDDMYKSCCNSSGRSDDIKHLARVLQFLIGTKTGKSEPMAIGGPWSRSLDGPDPGTNPQTLVNTAIRTTRQLTGIDLSQCTRWYRFVEVEYLRTDSKKYTVPKCEKVVMFLPDVWSCVPSMLDYMALQDKLTTSLIRRVRPPPAEPMEMDEKEPEAETAETTSSQDASNKSDEREKSQEPPASQVDNSEAAKEEQPYGGEDKSEAEQDQPETTDKKPEPEASQLDDSEMDTSVVEDSTIEGGSNQATHWSKVDVKSLKVAELRAEIEARGESSKGLKKQQLVTKLNKLLKTEEEEGVPAVEEVTSTQPDVEEENKVVMDTKGNGTEKSEAESTNDMDTDNAGDSKSNKETEASKVVAKESDAPKETSKEAEKKSTKEAEPSKDNENIKEKKEKMKDPNVLTAEQNKEKIRLEKYYKLPTDPSIVVQPDRTARNGTFDCSVVSLNVLLDYRHDDTKQHTFEVSLFAEAFNEMLMRDFGFLIYCRLEEHSEYLGREELRRKEEERKAKEENERREREEKERKEREEKERKEKEEIERKEKEERERKEKEERERKEKEERERKEKEERERKEKEDKEKEDKEKEDEEQAEKEDESADENEVNKEAESADEDEESNEAMNTTADGETLTKSDEITEGGGEKPTDNKVESEEKKPEQNKEDNTKVEVKTEVKTETAKEDKSEAKKEEKKSDKKEEKRSKNKEESEEPERKRTRHADEDEKRAEKRSGPRVHTTVDKESLLAFSYYDSSRCGYITERDLEEIVQSLGLHLTKNQVRKVVHKAASSGQVHYMQFSEIPEDKLEDFKAKRVKLDRTTLAKGSRPDEVTPDHASSVPSTSSVVYNGAVVDLDNIMARLSEAGAQRLETEKQLKGLIDIRASVEKSVERLEEKNRKYVDDYRNVKENLSSTERELTKVKHTAGDYKRILMSSSQDLSKVLGRINTIVTPTPHQSGDAKGSEACTYTHT